MKIIGCDFHPSYQQIAMVDSETGELWEGRLEHEQGEARRFYQALEGQTVRVGMEAVGNSQWFEQMLAEMGHPLWIGDAARSGGWWCGTEDRPSRCPAHSGSAVGRAVSAAVGAEPAMRDVRQLLRHRQKLVEIRTQVKNQLQHLALNQGVRRKRRLWSRDGRGAGAVAVAGMDGAAAQRSAGDAGPVGGASGRTGWCGARGSRAAAGSAAVDDPSGRGTGGRTGVRADDRPDSRFPRGKHVASYLGLIPKEHSSGGRQNLGPISKQGNTLMRTLLVEAAQTAARFDEELRRDYGRLKARKHSALAKVMVARKLAVRMYWMLRGNKSYAQLYAQRPVSHAGQPGSFRGRRLRPSA